MSCTPLLVIICGYCRTLCIPMLCFCASTSCRHTRVVCWSHLLSWEAGRSISPSYLHIWGTAPPSVQVSRDNFSGPRVRKCIHIMHRISISSWHHNEHIVPTFVRCHIPASHFAWVIASSCICVQHTFVLQTAYLLFSCSLMHDPCIFLCKTKTKKGEAWKFTLHS